MVIWYNNHPEMSVVYRLAVMFREGDMDLEKISMWV